MDAKLFRQTMGTFATGVTVIAVKTPEGIHGMTANAFMSVSLDPPLILISVDRKAKMHDIIKNTEYFSVNILKEDQQAHSNHFAGRKVDGLTVEFQEKEHWAKLQGSLATVYCRLEQAIDGGDHTLYLGRVQTLEFTDGDPLIFYRGQYRKMLAYSNV
ncbi:MAG: flavin reductase family protein [Candidatus Carbobacillus sp.]|nr:flavin reductase family protein [Candidatus Carbobacillus sp.]